MNSALSLDQTPPLSAPLIFMLTAPFFSVLASIVALVNPEVFVSRWDPAMLAITHLLILGFITMVMVGALQQLFPVLVGVPIKNPLLFSRVIYSGIVTGTLLLSAGFLFSLPWLLGAGAVLLGVSFIWMITRLLQCLVQSAATRKVTLGMKLALVSFLLTLLLGLYLAAGYVLPGIQLQREITPLHILWGLSGWIGLLIFTVSYQVVPMFQVTPKYPEAMLRWLALVVFLGLMAISLVSLSACLPAAISAGIVIAAKFVLFCAFALFALTTMKLQSQRRRKIADVTMDFWSFGLLSLLLGLLVLAAAQLLQLPNLETDLLVGTLMIVGFPISLIMGMLYKIVPFLVWLHLTNTIDMSARWQLKIPNMKQIIPDKRARYQFRLHCLSVILLLSSFMTVELVVELVQFAAITFMLSNLCLAFNLISGAATYRRVVRQMEL